MAMSAIPAPYLGLPQLSAYAAEYDWLFLGMVVMAVGFLLPIFAAIIYFVVKYHKSRDTDRSERVTPKAQRIIELSWSLIPFGLSLIFYVWAARMYVDWASPPEGALRIDVVGKQWMWKFQHPGGQREINTLHVPMGQPVTLVMISQDVIHSLFLPELRIKHDVLPGRYTTLWFTANQTGRYRLTCTEFCGTDHATMGGQLIVLSPADYQDWLAQSGTDLSLAAEGEALFRRNGCSGCHGVNATVHAPSLGGIYGSRVRTDDGRDVTADDAYLRDCMMLPAKNRVAGFPPLMPSFQGKLGEDEVLKLIAYIRSLPPGARP